MMQNNKENNESIFEQGTSSIFEKVPIAKALNNKLKQATFVVMVPDVPDAHGDITSMEEVRKACFNFNKSAMQPNLFHVAKTDTFEFLESYITPVDMMIEDKFVTKGTWLTTIQSLDDDLWEMIESGDIAGISIGAEAVVETLEE